MTSRTSSYCEELSHNSFKTHPKGSKIVFSTQPEDIRKPGNLPCLHVKKDPHAVMLTNHKGSVFKG